MFLIEEVNTVIGRLVKRWTVSVKDSKKRCSINDLPTVSVAKIGDRWVTHDNRRLWVFRQLYRLGKCDTVPVNIKGNIPSTKMTSCNKGVEIQVRGDPGGQWHLKPSQRPNSTGTHQGNPSVYGHHQQDFADDEYDDPDQYVFDDYNDYNEHEYDDYEDYYEHDDYDDYGDYYANNDYEDYY